MKFFGAVESGPRNSRLDFGGDPYTIPIHGFWIRTVIRTQELFQQFINFIPQFLQKSEQPYYLRIRRHNYSLVENTSELNERDYITRILYKSCY